MRQNLVSSLRKINIRCSEFVQASHVPLYKELKGDHHGDVCRVKVRFRKVEEYEHMLDTLTQISRSAERAVDIRTYPMSVNDYYVFPTDGCSAYWFSPNVNFDALMREGYKTCKSIPDQCDQITEFLSTQLTVGPPMSITKDSEGVLLGMSDFYAVKCTAVESYADLTYLISTLTIGSMGVTPLLEA